MFSRWAAPCAVLSGVSTGGGAELRRTRVPPLCDVGPRSPVGGRGGGRGRCCSGSHSILQTAPEPVAPSLLSFLECSPRTEPGRTDMAAGYLKVISSLSRAAGAAFSRNPAVLAPAANCQILQQRNCE